MIFNRAFIIFLIYPVFVYSQVSIGPVSQSLFLENNNHFEHCNIIFNKLVATKADRSERKLLQNIIYSFLDNCNFEDSDSPDVNLDEILNSKPTLYTFTADPDFYILWDGVNITFDQRALSTAQLTLSENDYNIVNIIDRKIIDEEGERKNIFSQVREKSRNFYEYLKEIKKEGKPGTLITLYAWHNRATYTREKIAELNELTLGLGFKRTILNESSNRESVSFSMFLDSHSDPQVNFTYEWGKLFAGENLQAWLGYSAGLAIRSDFSYIPIPFILPTVGAKVNNISLNTIYIPRLSGENNGNVLFFYAEITR